MSVNAERERALVERLDWDARLWLNILILQVRNLDKGVAV